MGQGKDENTNAPAALLVLAWRDQDALLARIADPAWSAIVPHRTIDPARAFVDSGASVVLVDARGSIDPALEAAGGLGGLIESRSAALLVLLARGDTEMLTDFYAAGATHFLIDSGDASEVREAIRFAARHAERTGGKGDPEVERRGGPTDDRDAGDARRWLDARIAAGLPVGVVLASLSRLDIVNAAYGRPVGDALIDAAGRRIATTARAVGGEGLLTLRIGAAEYALLVEDATADRIEVLAARLGEALARPFIVEGATAALGSRLGVALADAGDDGAALMRRASMALIRAKASDGATMHVADAEGATSIDSLAVDLHHAIERGEIDILFQPQVEIASGRITGVEALARWEHGALGVLGAEALFAAAERADLGIALSEHIQRLVLARAARWPQALAGLRVSVNLTAADVARPGYAALFLARLDASGFPRGRLTIEVTESGLMEDLTAASAFLAALRGAGCRVAIDDFGTGYSSLAYLKTLPLDYLKIDRALTRDIGGSARDRVVVGGVITMARSLGLGVIAEGVETTDQRALLAAAGCDLYQGFLTAPPLDEAALVAMMAGE
ncbi:bifunctional diguanylate cyclase/phosphodiesterase [Sphingomonas bacterium]|uniref:putative bifunctional diguanylate cyclase/phosphodiesterase n=1 Tax=Sphingomonas bacterium TaxID=1895847 RepID=UPI0015760EDB|nr:GGDEF domain-containing phosphodiesterase [Sphingomonas bacterium]